MTTREILTAKNNKDFSTEYDDCISVFAYTWRYRSADGDYSLPHYGTAIRSANNKSAILRKILFANYGNGDTPKAKRLCKFFDYENDVYVLEALNVDKVKSILASLEVTPTSASLKPKKTKKKAFLFRIESDAQILKLRCKVNAIIESRASVNQDLARYISEALNTDEVRDFATWTKDEAIRINEALEK